MRQLVLCLLLLGLSACAVRPDWDLQDPRIDKYKAHVSAEHSYYQADKLADYFTNN